MVRSIYLGSWNSEQGVTPHASRQGSNWKSENLLLSLALLAHPPSNSELGCA